MTASIVPEPPGPEVAAAQSKPGVSELRVGRMGIRPAATFSGAMMAIAGLLGTAGLLSLILGDSTGRGAVVATAALVAVVGYALVYFKARLAMPAGLVAIIVGVVVFFVALIVDGDSGVGAVNTSLILSIIVLLGLYTAESRLAGQTPMMGASAILFWVVILIAVGNNGSVSIASDPFGQATDLANDASWASLVIGVVYLIATAMLDKRGKYGPGTAFAAAGNLAYLFGTFGVVGFLSGGNTTKALAVIAAGCWLGYVGGNGRRRFTTWTAGLIVLVGVGLLVAEIEDQNTRVIGLLLLIASLIIGGLAGAARNDPDGLSGLIAKTRPASNTDAALAEAHAPDVSHAFVAPEPPRTPEPPRSDEAFRPPKPQ